MSFFDLDEGMEQGKAGMKLVLDNNPVFSIEFAKFINNLPHGTIFTTDKIRQIWKGPLPDHVNGWGAATGAALRSGIIEKMPYMGRPDGVKSHGSVVHVYRRV